MFKGSDPGFWQCQYSQWRLKSNCFTDGSLSQKEFAKLYFNPWISTLDFFYDFFLINYCSPEVSPIENMSSIPRVT